MDFRFYHAGRLQSGLRQALLRYYNRRDFFAQDAVRRGTNFSTFKQQSFASFLLFRLRREFFDLQAAAQRDLLIAACRGRKYNTFIFLSTRK